MRVIQWVALRRSFLQEVIGFTKSSHNVRGAMLGFVPQPNLQEGRDGEWSRFICKSVSCWVSFLNPTYKRVAIQRSLLQEGRDSEIAPTKSQDSEVAPTKGRDSEIVPTKGRDSEIAPTRETNGRDSEIAPTKGRDSEIAPTRRG